MKRKKVPAASPRYRYTPVPAYKLKFKILSQNIFV